MEAFKGAFLAALGERAGLAFDDAKDMIATFLNVTGEAAREVFDHLDVNGDGSLSLDEFLVRAPALLRRQGSSIEKSSSEPLAIGRSPAMRRRRRRRRSRRHPDDSDDSDSDNDHDNNDDDDEKTRPHDEKGSDDAVVTSTSDNQLLDTPTRRAQARFQRLLTAPNLPLHRLSRSPRGDRSTMTGSAIRREGALIAVGFNPDALRLLNATASRSTTELSSPRHPLLQSPTRPASLAAMGSERPATLAVTACRPSSLSPMTAHRLAQQSSSSSSSSPARDMAQTRSLPSALRPQAMRRQRSRSTFSFDSNKVYEIREAALSVSDDLKSPAARDTVLIDFEVYSTINPLAAVGVLHARVSQHITVGELCEHLSVLTSYGNESYGLFLQPTGSKDIIARFRQPFGEWLAAAQTLGLYMLGNGSQLEYRSTVRPLTVRLPDGSTSTATVNESLSVGDAVRAFALELGLVAAYEYGLKTAAGQWLHPGTTFAANSVNLASAELTLHKRFFFNDFRRDREQPADLRLITARLQELVHRGHFPLTDDELVELAALAAVILFGPFESFTHLQPDKTDRLRSHVRDAVLPAYVRSRRRKRDVGKLQAKVVASWSKKRVGAVEAQELYLRHLLHNPMFGVSVYHMRLLPAELIPVVRTEPVGGKLSSRPVPGARAVKLHLSKTTVEIFADDSGSHSLLQRNLRQIYRYAVRQSCWGPVLQVEYDDNKAFVLLGEQAADVSAELEGYIKCWIDTITQPTDDITLQSPPTTPPSSPRGGEQRPPAQYVPPPATQQQQQQQEEDSVELSPREQRRVDRSMMMSSRSKQIRLMEAMDVFDLSSMAASLASVLDLLQLPARHYSSAEMRSFSQPVRQFFVGGFTDADALLSLSSSSSTPLPSGVQVLIQIAGSQLPALLELLHPAQFTHVSTIKQPTVALLQSMFALAQYVHKKNEPSFLACCAYAAAQALRAVLCFADRVASTASSLDRSSSSLSVSLSSAPSLLLQQHGDTMTVEYLLLQTMLRSVELMYTLPAPVPMTDLPTQALVEQVRAMLVAKLTRLLPELNSSSAQLVRSFCTAIDHTAASLSPLLADTQIRRHVAGLVSLLSHQLLTPLAASHPSLELRDVRNLAAELLLATGCTDAPVVPSELMIGLKSLMTSNDISQPIDFARSFAMLFTCESPLFAAAAAPAMDVWFDVRSLLYVVELRRQYKASIALLLRLCSLVDLARVRQRRDNFVGPSFLDPVDNFLGLAVAALSSCRTGMQLVAASIRGPLQPDLTARLFRGARQLCVAATAVFQSALLIDLSAVAIPSSSSSDLRRQTSGSLASSSALSTLSSPSKSSSTNSGGETERPQLAIRSIASSQGPAAVHRLFAALQSYEEFRRCAAVSRVLDQLDSISGGPSNALPLLLLSSSTAAALQLFAHQHELKTPLQLCRQLVEQNAAVAALVAAPFAVDKLCNYVEHAALTLQQFVFLSLTVARTIAAVSQPDTPVDHTQHVQLAAQAFGAVVTHLEVHAILDRGAAQAGLAAALAAQLAELLRAFDLLAVRSLCIGAANQLDKLHAVAAKVARLSFQQFYGDSAEPAAEPNSIWKRFRPLLLALVRHEDAASLLPAVKLLLTNLLAFVGALAQECRAAAVDGSALALVQRGTDDLLRHVARLVEEVFVHRGLQRTTPLDQTQRVEALLALGRHLCRLVCHVTELLRSVQALCDGVVRQLRAVDPLQRRGDGSGAFTVDQLQAYSAVVTACVSVESALLQWIDSTDADDSSGSRPDDLSAALLPALTRLYDQLLAVAALAEALPVDDYVSFVESLTRALLTAVAGRSWTSLRAAAETSLHFRQLLAQHFPAVPELTACLLRISSNNSVETAPAPDIQHVKQAVSGLQDALHFDGLVVADDGSLDVSKLAQHCRALSGLATSLLPELLALRDEMNGGDELTAAVQRLFAAVHSCWLSVARSFSAPPAEQQAFRRAVDDVLRHLERETLVRSQAAAPELADETARACIAQLSAALSRSPDELAAQVERLPYPDVLFRVEHALLALAHCVRQGRQQAVAGFLTASAGLFSAHLLSVLAAVAGLPDVAGRRQQLVAGVQAVARQLVGLLTSLLCDAAGSDEQMQAMLDGIDALVEQVRVYDPVTVQVAAFLADYFACDLLPAFFALPADSARQGMLGLHGQLVAALKRPVEQLTELNALLLLLPPGPARHDDAGRAVAALRQHWAPLFATVAGYLAHEHVSVDIVSHFHRLTLAVCRTLQTFEQLLCHSNADEEDSRSLMRASAVEQRHRVLLQLGGALELHSPLNAAFEKSRAVLLTLVDETIAAVGRLVATSRALLRHSHAAEQSLKSLCAVLLAAVDERRDGASPLLSSSGGGVAALNSQQLRGVCKTAEQLIERLDAVAATPSNEQPLAFQALIEQIAADVQQLLPLLDSAALLFGADASPTPQRQTGTPSTTTTTTNNNNNTPERGELLRLLYAEMKLLRSDATAAPRRTQEALRAFVANLSSPLAPGSPRGSPRSARKIFRAHLVSCLQTIRSRLDGTPLVDQNRCDKAVELCLIACSRFYSKTGRHASSASAAPNLALVNQEFERLEQALQRGRYPDTAASFDVLLAQFKDCLPQSQLVVSIESTFAEQLPYLRSSE